MLQSRQSFFLTASPLRMSSRGRAPQLAPSLQFSCDLNVTRQPLRSVRRDAMQERQRNRNEKLRVLGLISACVESNAITQRFEEFAGRSAMVGFAIAVAAELAAPQKGLFGSWDSDDVGLYGATALLLVTVSALLATMSKRRLGLKFKEAVITSLTAFSRSRGSLTNQTVDSAVDYVFEEVFDKDMVLRNLIQDEFL